MGKRVGAQNFRGGGLFGEGAPRVVIGPATRLSTTRLCASRLISSRSFNTHAQSIIIQIKTSHCEPSLPIHAALLPNPTALFGPSSSVGLKNGLSDLKVIRHLLAFLYF